MGKDEIPDCLNSSLWSTTLSSGDDHIHRHSPSPTISSNAVFEPIVQPLVQVHPPVAALSPQSTATSPKSESRDQVDKNSDDNSNDNDQNASSSGGSPDDISRQAQILTEKVVNLWELRQIASQGIPEGLLLGYLPPDRVQWSYELAKKSQTEMARKLEKSVVRDNDHSESECSGLLSRSQDALKDILIVFAKLNPGIRYVQGMNKILAPLFYVFRNDTMKIWR
ncbi:hypothetical protein F3Y22_tig00117034pilonHSYRG00503 [Hibiscus syriacus]|uniref:Rab-GAP TBC domain-containing protein n=1 Tax=Hibiscus syriacus TaxID=106335 RepID=A0A6A2WZB3_HIBSY|nr:hypothetical protein F3Y22_tig00117034pilonHSYRG00503 [Hibiscus syriacus]